MSKNNSYPMERTNQKDTIYILSEDATRLLKRRLRKYGYRLIGNAIEIQLTYPISFITHAQDLNEPENAKPHEILVTPTQIYNLKLQNHNPKSYDTQNTHV